MPVLIVDAGTVSEVVGLDVWIGSLGECTCQRCRGCRWSWTRRAKPTHTTLNLISTSVHHARRRTTPPRHSRPAVLPCHPSQPKAFQSLRASPRLVPGFPPAQGQDRSTGARGKALGQTAREWCTPSLSLPASTDPSTAKFTHNPHITLPTSLDLAHPLQAPLSTFPHPLPTYLPRTLLVPPSRPPPSVPSTSSAGLFSLSLRGARRTLRARPSSAYLVKAIETHLAAWLDGGTYLNPDQAKGLLRFPGDPVGGREDIREVGREAGRLVWAVKVDPALGNPGYRDGGFERYVVHCVARWYGVVSFSMSLSLTTLFHLLTPLIRQGDRRSPPHVPPPPQCPPPGSCSIPNA